MKRSEVNNAIEWANDLLSKQNIRLPGLAHWSLDTWREKKDHLHTIRKTMLGWDISDYGRGEFDKLGAVLFTVRNGLVTDESVGVPYCEKYILMKDGQRLPKHYHIYKTEDIINRAGGTLWLKLFDVDPATGKETGKPVTVYCDGIPQTFESGEDVFVEIGDSITLPPYVAHIFGPKAGGGDLVVGEVSRINDDVTDNYFLEEIARFADIEEDVAPLRPLCNEYDVLIV